MANFIYSQNYYKKFVKKKRQREILFHTSFDSYFHLILRLNRRVTSKKPTH